MCAREMGDPQLALLLARLLDGAQPHGAQPPGGTAPSAGRLLQQAITSEMLPGDHRYWPDAL